MKGTGKEDGEPGSHQRTPTTESQNEPDLEKMEI